MKTRAYLQEKFWQVENMNEKIIITFASETLEKQYQLPCDQIIEA